MFLLPVLLMVVVDGLGIETTIPCYAPQLAVSPGNIPDPRLPPLSPIENVEIFPAVLALSEARGWEWTTTPSRQHAAKAVAGCDFKVPLQFPTKMADYRD